MGDQNLLDKAIEWISPRAAVRRAHAREVLSYYEAASPQRLRKGRRETGSGNSATLRAGASLRQQARHLEQNYDIALGVLNTLVINTVGPSGIGVEPQPRRADGSIHDVFARQILDLYKDWCKRPEVTWMHDWPSAQRMLARAWFRDGEVFAQIVEGTNAYIDHGTTVPLSLEMMEADFCPMELHAVTPVIQQGIEINAWGRPVGYHVYKTNAVETGPIGAGVRGSTKRIDASRMLHIANRHRIRQLRGVSVFASVLTRFDDLKDYEESERIAAKVAASMAAYIKKGSPDDYTAESDTTTGLRQLKFRAGMIFDDLKPGEEIGMIDSKRPNPNLETYRSGQIKAVAAGAGTTASSIRKTYDGNYSSQRQELVEAWSAYATLSGEFIGGIMRPVYERFVAMAILSGKLRVPTDVVMSTADDAEYVAPQIPWIDPLKEVKAWAELEDRAYASGPEIIRRRGGNPMDVLQQQARWLREKEAAGIPDADAKAAPGAPMQDDQTDDPAQPTPAHAMAAGLQAVGAAVAAMAAREPGQPTIEVRAGDVHVAAPEVHNHLPPAAAPDIHAHFEATMPAAADVNVTVEAVMPEQPAPVVNVAGPVVNMPAQSEMRITAMPDRQTTSEVVRDRAGNIITTTQTETDK